MMVPGYPPIWIPWRADAYSTRSEEVVLVACRLARRK